MEQSSMRDKDEEKESELEIRQRIKQASWKEAAVNWGRWGFMWKIYWSDSFQRQDDLRGRNDELRDLR